VFCCGGRAKCLGGVKGWYVNNDGSRREESIILKNYNTVDPFGQLEQFKLSYR